MNDKIEALREPDDWVLVPRKPTEEMINAHFEAHARAKTVFANVKDVWAAMLRAAPRAPAASLSELDLLRSSYLSLLSERDRLRAALEPFALVAERDIGDDEPDADLFAPMMRHNRAPRLTVGDLRRARAALTPEGT